MTGPVHLGIWFVLVSACSGGICVDLRCKALFQIVLRMSWSLRLAPGWILMERISLSLVMIWVLSNALRSAPWKSAAACSVLELLYSLLSCFLACLIQAFLILVRNFEDQLWKLRCGLMGAWVMSGRDFCRSFMSNAEPGRFSGRVGILSESESESCGLRSLFLGILLRLVLLTMLVSLEMEKCF